MMRQFLLQMAGASGTGKSSLALAIIQQVDAVIIDLDIVKSTALDAGTSWDMAGRIGYGVSRAIAKSILEQGKNVILDSPCRFQQIVDEGTAIASQMGVIYAFIECVLPDETLNRQRMKHRLRHRSQRVAFDRPPPDAPHDAMKDNTGKIKVPQTIYPDSPWIQVDTAQLLEVCVEEALAYLRDLCI